MRVRGATFSSTRTWSSNGSPCPGWTSGKVQLSSGAPSARTRAVWETISRRASTGSRSQRVRAAVEPAFLKVIAYTTVPPARASGRSARPPRVCVAGLEGEVPRGPVRDERLCLEDQLEGLRPWCLVRPVPLDEGRRRRALPIGVVGDVNKAGGERELEPPGACRPPPRVTGN